MCQEPFCENAPRQHHDVQWPVVLAAWEGAGGTEVRNVRKEGDFLVYDCDGSNCETPGVPHRISLSKVMATVETVFTEQFRLNDPRVEAVGVILQLLWQTQFDKGQDGSAVPTSNTPWDPSLSELIFELKGHYAGPPVKDTSTLIN